MADELDPNATALGAGDPADAGAEPAAGEPGHDESTAPTLEELQRQLADMQRDNKLLLDIASRQGNGRSSGEGAANPPTTPDPRATAAANSLAEIESEIEELKGDIRRLATEAKDPVSKMQLAMLKQQVVMKQQLGEALRMIYDQVQDLASSADIDDKERRQQWSKFRKEHGHRFADVEACKWAFESQHPPKAPAPVTPKPNGTKASVPVVGVRKVVDLSARTLDASAARKVVVMPDYDAQLAALHAAGDHEGARALQGRYNAGEIEVPE